MENDNENIEILNEEMVTGIEEAEKRFCPIEMYKNQAKIPLSYWKKNETQQTSLIPTLKDMRLNNDNSKAVGKEMRTYKQN